MPSSWPRFLPRSSQLLVSQSSQGARFVEEQAQKGLEGMPNGQITVDKFGCQLGAREN